MSILCCTLFMKQWANRVCPLTLCKKQSMSGVSIKVGVYKFWISSANHQRWGISYSCQHPSWCHLYQLQTKGSEPKINTNCELSKSRQMQHVCSFYSAVDLEERKASIPYTHLTEKIKIWETLTHYAPRHHKLGLSTSHGWILLSNRSFSHIELSVISKSSITKFICGCSVYLSVQLLPFEECM